MFQQIISQKGANAEDRMADVPKDPHNQQSVNILFLAVCPLILQAFSGGGLGWSLGVIATLVTFGTALWLISTGITRRKAHDAADVAHAPKYPRKLIGAALLGAAVATLGTMRFGHLGEALIYGALCSGLAVLAFGVDPLRNKGLDTVADRDRHRTETAAETAQTRMKIMAGQIAALGDTELDMHVGDFAAALNRMLDAARGDPARLRALRQHLGIYLDGAEEATTRFVALFRTTGDASARADYLVLLCDLAEEFQTQATHYAMGGKDKLNVQIDVLRHKMGKSRRT